MDVEKLRKIREGIPPVRDWIARYIADPAHVYRPLDLERFRRLPLHFSAEILGKVRVATVERIEVAPVAHLGPFVAEFEQAPTIVTAASAQDRIFVLPVSEESESVHFQQVVRLVQWDEAGGDLFLLSYFSLLAEVGFRRSPLIDLIYRLGAAFDRGETLPGLEDDIRRRTREIVAPYRDALGISA